MNTQGVGTPRRRRRTISSNIARNTSSSFNVGASSIDMIEMEAQSPVTHSEAQELDINDNGVEPQRSTQITLLLPHRKEITLLRLYALLLLVLFHSYPARFQFAVSGFNIIFMCSGYLVARSTYHNSNVKSIIAMHREVLFVVNTRIFRSVPSLLMMLLMIAPISYNCLTPTEIESIKLIPRYDVEYYLYDYIV